MKEKLTIQEIKELLESDELVSPQVIEIFSSLGQMIDNKEEKETLSYLTELLYQKCLEEKLFVDDCNQLYLNMLVQRSYSISYYFYKGRKYALNAYKLLERLLPDKDNKYEEYANIYVELGDYFKKIFDYDMASKCYNHAKNYFINVNRNKDYIAYVYAKELKCSCCYEEKFINEEEILHSYGQYSKPILQIAHHQFLKHDPIEKEVNFQEKIDKVFEAMGNEMLKQKKDFTRKQRWDFMKKELKKYQISWKTPQEMNPDYILL